MRRTGNSNSDDGNSVAGIEGSSGFVRGDGMVPPKHTKDGDEAEGAEYLMEIGGIDGECSCSMM